MSYFLPTMSHSTEWGDGLWQSRGPGARLTIAFAQEYLAPVSVNSMNTNKVKGNKMRVTFNLEIKAEIPSYDTKQREVFVKLMTQAAKRLYTQSALMSTIVSPDMKVTVGEGGKIKEITLFAGEEK